MCTVSYLLFERHAMVTYAAKLLKWHTRKYTKLNCVLKVRLLKRLIGDGSRPMVAVVRNGGRGRR